MEDSRRGGRRQREQEDPTSAPPFSLGDGGAPVDGWGVRVKGRKSEQGSARRRGPCAQWKEGRYRLLKTDECRSAPNSRGA
jgi:hypothetical protein